MGGACTRDRDAPQQVLTESVPVPITLNVYDMGTCGGGYLLNRLLQPFGTGAFHCGVEVYGMEWSYSDVSSPKYQMATGVFACTPRQCEGHSYQQSLAMGTTGFSELQLSRLIASMEKAWVAGDYDIFRHNCCHFSDTLCRQLGVGPVPPWVMSLASAAADVAVRGSCCRLERCCAGAAEDPGLVCIVEQISAIDRIPAERASSRDAEEEKTPSPFVRGVLLRGANAAAAAGHSPAGV